MKLWARIKQLDKGQLTRFGFFFLRNPRLTLPTLKATEKTFTICNSLYGKQHHKTNKANAFRHALWNVLLCKGIYRNKTEAQRIYWAEKITDLYENVTKNDPLDRAMDMHNNRMGRSYFLSLLNENKEEIVHFLQKKAENAQKVAKIEEIDIVKNSLVYISE
jgi:hypothetical protein